MPTRILIGADVDPVLPANFTSRLTRDIWAPLKLVPALLELLGSDLPAITWLIRSDESVRVATGEYDSGYTSQRALWEGLLARGHEIGWHVHLMSVRDAALRFDGDPAWLGDALAALAGHYPVRATRTGWDYASNTLFQRFEQLGVKLDFSALPGSIAWQRAGVDRIIVDWRRAPAVPYHPSRSDYMTVGGDALRLLEVPIAQFAVGAAAMVKRVVWRAAHGVFSTRGLTRKTLRLTQPWPCPPEITSDLLAFYFHPEDLTAEGIVNFRRNLGILRRMGRVEFVTASSVCEEQVVPG